MDIAKHDEEESFAGVPLFPLSDAVLFPKQLMPLHIFEPRYRRMTEDALRGDRLIVIAHIDPGSGVANSGNPPIAETATVGRIVYDQRLDDGRFMIALKGLERVRIRELEFEPPYRRGDLVVAPSTDLAKPTDPDVAALEAIGQRILGQARAARPDIDLELPSRATPGALVDACAYHFVAETKHRQELLEETNERHRVTRCLEMLLEEFPDSPSMLN